MDILSWLNSIVIIIGVPTIAGALLFIGRKLQLLDGLEQTVKARLEPDVRDLRERLATLEGRTANLFASQSPIKLTPAGRQFLTKSGLKAYIDDHTEEFLGISNQLRDVNTPYDVQEAVNELFDRYDFPQEIEDGIKTQAYLTGTSYEVARRIGALYFRDICLEAFGFTAEPK